MSASVVRFPNSPPSAREVLERTIGKLDRVKSVAIVIQWDDDSMDVDLSRMRVSELCMAAMVLDEQARAAMISDDD